MSVRVTRLIGADGQFAGPPTDVTPGAGYKVVRLPSGPAGANGKQDLNMGGTRAFASGELIWGPVALGGIVAFSEADSSVVVEVAPATQAVFTITKNGVLWATATVEAGELDGIVEFDTEPSGELRDVIRLIAPNPGVVGLQGVGVTLASV